MAAKFNLILNNAVFIHSTTLQCTGTSRFHALMDSIRITELGHFLASSFGVRRQEEY